MAITINGTTGIAGVDGSAGTPAVQGADTNTGVFYPAADTVGVSTGGSEKVRVDSSGNVGINTSSPTEKLSVAGNTTSEVYKLRSNTSAPAATDAFIFRPADNTLGFGTNATERMRIDSSGNLLVGCTSTPSSSIAGRAIYGGTGFFQSSCGATTTTYTHFYFTNGNGNVGTITTNASATAYNTSSDYRLKKSVQPMTGALARISALKPVTYKWNADNSDGEGFIAHELADVVPQCVTGEKDAVDADGNPVYQGVDASFLIATLTAAIQEQQALIQQLQADVAALKGTS